MQAKKDFEIQTNYLSLLMNYSKAETIQGRKLFKDGNYSRKYGN